MAFLSQMLKAPRTPSSLAQNQGQARYLHGTDRQTHRPRTWNLDCSGKPAGCLVMAAGAGEKSLGLLDSFWGSTSGLWLWLLILPSFLPVLQARCSHPQYPPINALSASVT